MARQLTWLHLSDFHFRSGDQYDQSIVLSTLLEDLIKVVDEKKKIIDVIFVTGDIAFSGRAEEYEIAARFFRDLSSATSVSMDRIYCVPGNHDNDRTRITPFLSNSVKALNTRELVSNIIGNKQERELFVDRQYHFYEFMRSTFPWAVNLDPTDLSYTKTIKINDLHLTILGLNSAWVAGSDSDNGSLVIGERQVRKALEKTTNSDFIVGLMHHPLSWLAEFDAADVRPLLDTRCDFLLHGHVHELGVVNVVSPDSEAYHLAAGASYQGRRELLSYNTVELNLDNGQASVSMRLYSDKQGGFWAQDTGTYRSAPDGVLSLALPERLSHQIQSPDLSALNERLSVLISETAIASAPSEPIPSVPRIPAKLVKEIKDGRCVLFAGAGASMDAKLPSWIELLRGMIERSDDSGSLSKAERSELDGLLMTGDHMVVAAFCRDRLGVFEFAEYLREQLTATNRTSRTHRILAEIPFRAAITTNFDSFIEHSRDRTQIVLPNMMENMGAAGVESLIHDTSIFPVIKMHGTAIDVDSIVLTRGDFRKVLFEKDKYREFLQRLFTDTTVFFYGYSFSDPSVDYLLQELMSSYHGNTRPHYALLPRPGEIATRYWFEDLNVRVIPYDLWEGSHAVSTAFLQELADQCQ
jgi:3',5'-cyclic AMP phosphodiesterase CpdA